MMISTTTNAITTAGDGDAFVKFGDARLGYHRLKSLLIPWLAFTF